MNRKVIVVMTIDDTGVTLKDKFDRVCDHNNTVAWFQEKIRDNTEDEVLPYNLILTIDQTNKLMTIKGSSARARENARRQIAEENA
tara:strand:- start:455 stop:712 length:258 start_codon:yes stop_codon:yes gene_type:complete